MRLYCYRCKTKNADIHKHHLVPRIYKGPNTRWNLVLLCPKCHSLIEHKFRMAVDLVVHNMHPATRASKTSRNFMYKQIADFLRGIIRKVDEKTDPCVIADSLIAFLKRRLDWQGMKPLPTDLANMAWVEEACRKARVLRS